MNALRKIAFGGGCHWCTEAIFQSLRGVKEVQQGFVSSVGRDASFSEAVIVHYFPDRISLKDLVFVHLYTHKSTSTHRLRKKYRSAIYTMEQEDKESLEQIWDDFQAAFGNRLITRILPFKAFKSSREEFQDYYLSNPDKPFCKRYIVPKLQKLQEKFPKQTTTA